MLNDQASSDSVYKELYLREVAPPHPGEVLRDDMMPVMGLSRTALAKRLGVSVKRLSNFLSERTPVTADLAMRLGALLGHGSRYWLGLQMQHDLWMTGQPAAFDIRPLEWKKASKVATPKRSGKAGYR